MTPDLMAARLAQIETELRDLAAGLGDGPEAGLSEIPDPIDRLAIATRSRSWRWSAKPLLSCSLTRLVHLSRGTKNEDARYKTAPQAGT